MFFFELGIRHIADLQGFDHMLFLLALTLPLRFSLWKPTLKWVTAFTVGHSLSLILSALDWVQVPGDWIEFGIAATIALTVLGHWITSFKVARFVVWTAGLFGIIHGFGFGSYYQFIAQNDQFWWAWLPFNLGIEVGQLAIVLVLLFVYWAFQFFSKNGKVLPWVLSGVAMTLSVQLVLERWPF
jgi:hydrogenase/urease accessory protein HupE